MSRDLEGVKIGDYIKVNERYSSGVSLHKVERVTATRAVCEKASFMIDSGVQIGTRSGGRWPTSKYGVLVKDADEVVAIQKSAELKRRINVAQARVSRIQIDEENLLLAEALIKFPGN